jgi:hypothetical protein
MYYLVRRFNSNDVQDSASKNNQSLALSLTDLLPTWKGNGSAPATQQLSHIQSFKIGPGEVNVMPTSFTITNDPSHLSISQSNIPKASHRQIGISDTKFS